MTALHDLEVLAREMREEYIAAAKRHEERLHELERKLAELAGDNSDG